MCEQHEELDRSDRTRSRAQTEGRNDENISKRRGIVCFSMKGKDGARMRELVPAGDVGNSR